MAPPSETDRETARMIVRALEAFGPLYRGYVGKRLPEGVSEARLRALAALATHGEMTMSELRARIGGTAQNVTGIVDALEREGQALRRPHGTDRRKTVIALADAARSDVLDKREGHRAAVAALFDVLPEDERAALLGALNRLISALKADAAS